MNDEPRVFDLQVGDQAILAHGGFSRARSVVTVSKLTKTQITISNGGRFNRQSGREIGGGSYTAAYLYAGTPERIAEVHREREERRLINKFTHETDWKKFELAVLKKVEAALQ
jgi:hypothetical protein